MHEVYSPNKSVTIGGHFLTYDSLHLTAVSRAFDAQNEYSITNQSHHSVHPILAQMLVKIATRTDRCLYALLIIILSFLIFLIIQPIASSH